jgi:heme/copper-type cytochrome/quinol oxidase subunit 2
MRRYRILIQCIIAAVVLLILGLLADLIFNVRAFTDHLLSIPLVLATFTPWVALFLVISGVWATIVDLFFRRHNQGDDRGLSYELTHDNNTGAAVLLTGPILIMAVLLTAISLLTD